MEHDPFFIKVGISIVTIFYIYLFFMHELKKKRKIMYMNKIFIYNLIYMGYPIYWVAKTEKFQERGAFNETVLGN